MAIFKGFGQSERRLGETLQNAGKQSGLRRDGTSDFPAIESADVRFAIRGSSLAELCERRGVQCSQITSFGVVADAVKPSLERGGGESDDMTDRIVEGESDFTRVGLRALLRMLWAWIQRKLGRNNPQSVNREMPE